MKSTPLVVPRSRRVGAQAAGESMKHNFNSTSSFLRNHSTTQTLNIDMLAVAFLSPHI
jgi:hypothetical protein